MGSFYGMDGLKTHDNLIQRQPNGRVWWNGREFTVLRDVLWQVTLSYEATLTGKAITTTGNSLITLAATQMAMWVARFF